MLGQTNRQTNRWIDIWTNKQIFGQKTDVWTNKQMFGQANRRTNRRTEGVLHFDIDDNMDKKEQVNCFRKIK